MPPGKREDTVDIKTFRGMKYRRMGHSGLWVSEVGLGTWKWGDPSYDGSRVGEHDGFQILDRALELGITHWDTANSYNASSGNSERLLGRYLKSRGPSVRDKVVLATKVRNAVREEHEPEREFTPNESGSSRKYIVQAVEGCLRRLQTDHIDVLYHHSPDRLPDGSWSTPLDEVWDAFDQLVRQGKVLYLAVSNRTMDQLEEESAALTGVAANPSHRIIGVQNWYNVLQRGKVSSKEGNPTIEDEQAFLSYIAGKGIGLIPFVPLAVGLLTGRYRKGHIDATGRLSEQAGEGWRDQFLTEANLERVDQLDIIARQKGCSLAQLAIAWLLAHEVVCSVIAGVTRMEQLIENAGAISVSLSEEELAQIDRLTR